MTSITVAPQNPSYLRDFLGRFRPCPDGSMMVPPPHQVPPLLEMGKRSIIPGTSSLFLGRDPATALAVSKMFEGFCSRFWEADNEDSAIFQPSLPKSEIRESLFQRKRRATIDGIEIINWVQNFDTQFKPRIRLTPNDPRDGARVEIKDPTTGNSLKYYRDRDPNSWLVDSTICTEDRKVYQRNVIRADGTVDTIEFQLSLYLNLPEGQPTPFTAEKTLPASAIGCFLWNGESFFSLILNLVDWLNQRDPSEKRASFCVQDDYHKTLDDAKWTFQTRKPRSGSKNSRAAKNKIEYLNDLLQRVARNNIKVFVQIERIPSVAGRLFTHPATISISPKELTIFVDNPTQSGLFPLVDFPVVPLPSLPE